MTLGIISNQMVLDDLSSLKSEEKVSLCADGKMLTGHQVYNGRRCSFSESGALKQQGKPFNLAKIDSNWYFYDEDGLKTIGKGNINGSYTTFNQEGIMQTGWAFVDGPGTIFASSGAMKTGWVRIRKHGIIWIKMASC